MQAVGPAVQTLGGLLRLTNKETFYPASEIARKARLPHATVRKHLVTLDANGWIANRGRQHTRSGRPRRTATIAITKKTTDHLDPYGCLPWWACCHVQKVGRLPWCAKAVLSVFVARLMSLKAAAEKDADVGEVEELAGALDNMGGEDRFAFPLDSLTRQTGLTRDSVITAKRLLNHRFGVIQWIGTKPKRGEDTLCGSRLEAIASAAGCAAAGHPLEDDDLARVQEAARRIVGMAGEPDAFRAEVRRAEVAAAVFVRVYAKEIEETARLLLEFHAHLARMERNLDFLTV